MASTRKYLNNSLVFDFFQSYLFSSRAGAIIKRISWLSVLGLFLSVAAMVIVLSVMTALNVSIRKRVLAVEPHLTVEFPAGSSFAVLDSDPLTVSLKTEHKFEVQPFEVQDVIVRTMDGRFHGALARGVSEQSYKHLSAALSRNSAHESNGVDKRETWSTPSSGEVDIGVDLARSLGVFEGDSLMVIAPEALLLPPSEAPPFDRVKVRRILSTNISEIDSLGVFYLKGSALTALRSNLSRKNGLEVWLPEVEQAPQLKEQIIERGGYRVETWQEKNSALFFALRMEKTIISIFLSMAALVAAFSLLTVLTLLTSQKRREIGVLRALGFSRVGLQTLFSRMGYGLAFCGVGGGLIFGLLVSLYLEKFPLNILPDIYYDSQIPAKVDFVFISILIVVASVLSWLGARASGNQVAKDYPSEMIRESR